MPQDLPIRKPSRGKMIGWWIAYLVAGALMGMDTVGLYSGPITIIGYLGVFIACVAYAVWNTKQGRRWYGVFALIVPIYNLVLFNRMFRSWSTK